ncbi:hypothetical protein [Streptomyces vinaceus]|uniref:hypothetical protein n=1 Tax=Streptomyces vinaceus TaxID=1960 RepID=UPI0036C54FA5
MNTVDPLRWISDHRDGIIRWTIVAALALLLFLLVRHFAMKLGGWRAAWRRVMREVAVSAAAFAAPVRAWLRYRRVRRSLIRRLGDPESWRDAERALAAARLAAAPARPYAVLVDDGGVTVLLAGLRVPAPPEPWKADPDLPDRWTARRTDLPAVVPEAGRDRPVVVAVGAEDGPSGRCAFLDLMSGPPTLTLDGDRRACAALLATLGAQLGVRLPPGLLIAADGVLRGFPGAPVREAYRTAKDTPPRLGTPPFLVAPELPDPLPPELAGPPDEVPATRILVRGHGRGYVRRLYADRHGQLSVTGTPLLLMSHALPRAVARTLKRIPPVHPPTPAVEGLRGPFAEEDGPVDPDHAPRAERAEPVERDPDEGIPTVAAAPDGSGLAARPVAVRAAAAPGPRSDGGLPSGPEAAAADPHTDPGLGPGPGPDSGDGAGPDGAPVIWAGSDADPGVWTGLVGAAGAEGDPGSATGAGPAAGIGRGHPEPEGEESGRAGPERRGPGAESESDSESDPDAGVPAASPGPAPRS